MKMYINNLMQALNLLPTIDEAGPWPVLPTQDWLELKELCPFLELFKELTLPFSTPTECRMDFEDLLVDIKFQYIDKKEEIQKDDGMLVSTQNTRPTKQLRTNPATTTTLLSLICVSKTITLTSNIYSHSLDNETLI
jgi:hypothetical protein